MTKPKRENAFKSKFSFLTDEAPEPEATELEPVQEERSPEPDSVAVPEPPPPAAPAVQPSSTRRRKGMGKRSNPDYEQIGVYIPKLTALQVRQKLAGRKDLDLSDLVASLLDNWLSAQLDK